MEPEEFSVHMLTCEDLSVGGVWEDKRCCKKCHLYMVHSPMAGGFLMDRDGETVFSSSRGLFSIRTCHLAFKALNTKLPINDLRTVFELALFQNEMVFDMFQDLIDQNDTTRISSSI